MNETQPVAGASAAPARVMLVDDDPLTLELHRTFLERIEGFVVSAECLGARAATEVMSEDPEAFDLVLLDVTMPDGTGLDVLRHARALGVRADVIAVSGVRDAEVVRDMVALGAVQYLIKPFAFSTFRERMEQFREYHARALQAAGQATQFEVDALFAALRPTAEPVLPKGLSASTLERVIETLRAGEAWSSSELADHLGISRVVARRYLEFLAGSGRIERSARYGSKGRPQTEYRWDSRQRR